MYARLAARDLAIAALAVLVWRVAAPLSADAGAQGDLTGLVAGLAFGAGAYLAHEWGHLAGAVLGGSTVYPARSLRSAFVFSFDSRANSRRQFLAMSFAGFAATAVAVWIAYGVLPSELLAVRVARGAVALLTLLGLGIELPLVVWSVASRRLPPVETFARQPEAPRAAVF
jgi:hypothetical protein